MTRSSIFIACFFLCAILGSAVAVFGHGLWNAAFGSKTETSSNAGIEFPKEFRDIQKLNARLTELGRAVAQTSTTSFRDDPVCRPNVDGGGVCNAAIEGGFECWKLCMDEYYRRAGCGTEANGNAPSAKCWDVYAGFATGRTSETPVSSNNNDFSFAEREVYRAIQEEKPFVGGRTEQLTVKVCSRTDVDASFLEALGGSRCRDIR